MQIKNADPMAETKRRQMLAVKVSMAGSITLFLISAVVGIAVDSVTLILDASASLVILGVAFLMNFSISKIHRPADEMYNFGYNKYEPLTASVQGILIFAACLFAIKIAIQDIIHAEDIANHFLPVAATFAASILGVFITLYLKRLSRNTGSNMLRAAGLHWYMDTVLSFGVCFGFLLGLLLQRAGYVKITPYVDPVMAIALALILVWVPFKTVIHNVRELLDAVPRDDSYARIKGIVDMRKPDSLGVHRLRMRKAGEKIFLDIILTVKDNLSVFEIEKLANKLDKDIRSDLGNCDILISFKSHK
ncbi:MAG: cation diffusion facilitator family transporter [Candidatus Omnitrophica bacterium]|nr:cation diffusion facilitator family transporter [Candidatus Omnitrophota bacterium]